MARYNARGRSRNTRRPVARRSYASRGRSARRPARATASRGRQTLRIEVVQPAIVGEAARSMLAGGQIKTVTPMGKARF